MSGNARNPRHSWEGRGELETTTLLASNNFAAFLVGMTIA